MRLQFKATTKDGKIVQGIIEAKDKQQAATYLRSKDLYPIKVDEKGEGGIMKSLPFVNRIGSSDVVFFTRQLSSMLVSGLNLMQSLTILKEQIQNPNMKEVVKGIISDIEEGSSLNVALSKYPDIFSKIYVSTVRAGETSGLLDKVLLRLADNLEKGERLKGTIKSALLYPIIVIIGMVIVAAIMMTVVIPQLSTLYTSLHVDLPITTQIVVGLSSFTIKFWPLILGLIVLIALGFNRVYKTEPGRLLIDKWTLDIPIFGKIIEESILTEFTRTFGLLVGSGTLVVESLKETAEVAGNLMYKNAIIGVAKRVEKGVSVGDALSAYPIFTPIIIQMVKVGEETGKLDESLLKVSEYYEREVDLAVKNLTTALEPIILVILGAGVAFLIIAVITPIYSLINAIGT